MARCTVFLDANVLVPIVTCDTLLRLADASAFRPLWSQRVIEKAQRALERIHPDLDPSRFVGLEAITVDEFLVDQFDLDPRATIQVIEEQARRMRRPPVELSALLDRLARSGAPKFARVVGAAIEEAAAHPAG